MSFKDYWKQNGNFLSDRAENFFFFKDLQQINCKDFYKV